MAITYSEQLKHPNWQRKRLEIFTRDNWACKICGNTEMQLHTHHLYYEPNILAWEYDNESIQTVCELHHNQITKDMGKLSGLIAFKLMKDLTPEQIFKISEIIKYT